MEDEMPAVFSRDLSDEYFVFREKKAAELALKRSIILKRFLKLVSILSRVYIWHKSSRVSYFQSIAGGIPYIYSKNHVAEEEKNIVGFQNWQDDKITTQCGLCHQSFDFLNRKHHCRLCGTLVDESVIESEGAISSCSAVVPIPLLLRKLPNLNYSPDVKLDWDSLCNADSDKLWYSLSFSFRCCKICKDALIHEVKMTNDIPLVVENNKILEKYGEFLTLKVMITNLFCRYRDAYHNETQLVRLRSKILDCVKELEHKGSYFKSKMNMNNPTDAHTTIAGNLLVTNIYKSLMMTLLEVILQLKTINVQLHTQAETPSSSKQLEEELTTKSPPKLSKRDIRERREQLMVINEQKFLIEGLIKSTRAQRKFDEVATLEASKIDLEIKIKELEADLGEFGF